MSPPGTGRLADPLVNLIERRARRRDVNALPHLLATGQPGLLLLSAVALLAGLVLTVTAVRLRPRRRSRSAS